MTGSVRRVRLRLCLQFVICLNIGYFDGYIDSYYVYMVNSLEKRLLEIKGFYFCDALCDCVLYKIKARKLSITPRVAPRVDFEPFAVGKV